MILALHMTSVWGTLLTWAVLGAVGLIVRGGVHKDDV